MTRSGLDTQLPTAGVRAVDGSRLRLTLRQIAPIDGDRQALLAQITVRMLPQLAPLPAEAANRASVELAH